ncbi:MAG: RNA 2',3'-cyclic phosphodiesterase [Bifidobacteriaceae bacterium]|jgi:2'-5' RNA ligase|nr:RNA 2',3'-cyclic phosphodiesterase [Bifidobacteriaceae bacterium]
MRLFAAVRPPTSALDHLSTALAAALGPRADRSSPLQPRANWHITLAFYGEVPGGAIPELAAELAANLDGIGQFRLELRGAGRFGRKTGWVGVGGDTAALERLARAAAAAWPGSGGTSRAAGRRPRPHLTLSRAADRPATSLAFQALAVYVGPTWPVREVRLARSQLGQGPGRHSLYTDLAALPLAAPAAGGAS